MVDLTPRDREILEGLVRLWEDSNHEPFDIPPGADTIEHPAWPEEIATPRREEVRTLVHRKLLDHDDSIAPGWRVWPSQEARALAPTGSDEQSRAEALKDADQRLGIILDAIVEAFEADPSEPLLIFGTSVGNIIKHPGWQIEPDVVRAHDLSQLADLGLVGRQSATEFYPTPRGRMATRSPVALLSQLADEAGDEEERSRLQRWADKLRAGDVAVSAAGSFTGYLIRALLGLEPAATGQ